MEKTVQLGQLVSSKAGRDKGKYYLAVQIGSPEIILVADGAGRKMQAPKPKNIKHLVVHKRIAAAVADRLQVGQNVGDSELRSALNALLGGDGQAPDRSEEVD